MVLHGSDEGLGPDLVHEVDLAFGVPESPLRSDAREHGVVDVDGLGLEV